MTESITRKPVATASKQSLSPEQHPVLVRLGRYALIVLSVGTITVVITFAFLCFLWTNNGNSYAWRNIMIHAWAPRAITISALIIRVSVVAQAGVCTSMLAALALENFEVLYTEAAGVSSIRYSHTGPESLFVRLAKGTRVLGPTRILFGTGTLLIITAVSQFASTALLADLRLDLVLSNYNTVDVHYGYNESRVNEVESTFRTESYWKGRPSTYAAFAEYSEDPYVAEGVSDTGLSLRAFLPFTSGTARSLLSSYIGMATVVDTRVTCIRPGHFKVLVEPYSDGDNLVVTGSINASTTSPRLQSLASTPVPFNCSIPLVTNSTFSNSDTPQDATEWMASICQLSNFYTPVGGLIPEFAQLTNDSALYSSVPHTYLVLNATGSFEQWQDFWSRSSQTNTTWLATRSNDKEWSTSDFEPGLGFSATICYSAFNSTDLLVELSSTKNRTEASLGWDLKIQTPRGVGGDWVTEPVRRQLGVTQTNLSTEDRGLMTLKPRSSWISDVGKTALYDVDLKPGKPTMQFVFQASDSQPFDYGVNFTSCMCTYCWAPVGANLVNRVQVALFQSVLKSTGHPALALQAHYTTAMQMVYYDRLPEFDVFAPARMRSYVEALVPKGRHGLIAVGIIIFLHFSTIILIVVLFLSLSKLSLLQNSWQPVAQLYTGETADVLRQATNSSDKDINAWLDRENKSKLLVGIGTSDSNRNIGIRRRG